MVARVNEAYIRVSAAAASCGIGCLFYWTFLCLHRSLHFASSYPLRPFDFLAVPRPATLDITSFRPRGFVVSPLPILTSAHICNGLVSTLREFPLEIVEAGR